MQTFREWLEKNEENEQKLENFRMSLHTFALNSYQRTRPFKDHPQDLMNKWLQRIRTIREWATKNFPCDLTNLDLAANAMIDAFLEFRKTGGILEPARYEDGADPRSAETLSQFAHFLHKRVNQKKVYGSQFEAFGKYWDAFIEDFEHAYQAWKA